MGTAFHGGFEQPLSNAFAKAGAQRQSAEKAGNMGNITQPAGQSWRGRLFLQFHFGDGNRERFAFESSSATGSFQPVDFDFLLQRLELRVAGEYGVARGL